MYLTVLVRDSVFTLLNTGKVRKDKMAEFFKTPTMRILQFFSNFQWRAKNERTKPNNSTKKSRSRRTKNRGKEPMSAFKCANLDDTLEVFTKGQNRFGMFLQVRDHLGSMKNKNDRAEYKKKNKEAIDESKLWITELAIPNYETVQHFWKSAGTTEETTSKNANKLETTTMLTGSDQKCLLCGCGRYPFVSPCK